MSAAGPSASAAGSEATFALAGEDHTLGNALRYMLNRQPVVAFAGYSVPHPSDDLVNVRVQTTGTVTATQALRDAVTGAWRLQRRTLRNPRRRAFARSAAHARCRCGRRLVKRVRARQHHVPRGGQARQRRQSSRSRRGDGGVKPRSRRPSLQRALCCGLRAARLLDESG